MTLRILTTVGGLALAIANPPWPANTWSFNSTKLQFTPDGRYVVARTFLGVTICEVPNGTVRGRSFATTYSDEVIENDLPRTVPFAEGHLRQPTLMKLSNQPAWM